MPVYKVIYFKPLNCLTIFKFIIFYAKLCPVKSGLNSTQNIQFYIFTNLICLLWSFVSKMQ